MINPTYPELLKEIQQRNTEILKQREKIASLEKTIKLLQENIDTLHKESRHVVNQ